MGDLEMRSEQARTVASGMMTAAGTQDEVGGGHLAQAAHGRTLHAHRGGREQEQRQAPRGTAMDSRGQPLGSERDEDGQFNGQGDGDPKGPDRLAAFRVPTKTLPSRTPAA